MSLTLRNVRVGLALAALLACGACGDDGKTGGGKTPTPKKDGAAAPKADGEAAPAAGGAYDKAKGTCTLKGVVKYVGTVPEQKVVVKGTEPTCESSKTVVEKTEVNAEGKTLPHCFVWVTSGPSLGLSGYEAGAVEVDQKGCTYIPHVFGVVNGQSVTFKNTDKVSHNVHVKGRKQEWNKSQSAGASDVYKPEKESAVKVSCDVHSWMSSYMFVVDHPFFAASAQGTGAYEITGLYPGKHHVKLWHENWAKDKAVEFDVELKAGENSHDIEVQGDK